MDEALTIVGEVAAKHQLAPEPNAEPKVLGAWARGASFSQRVRGRRHGNVSIVVIKRDREMVVSTNFFVGGEDLEVMQQVRRDLIEEFEQPLRRRERWLR